MGGFERGRFNNAIVVGMLIRVRCKFQRMTMAAEKCRMKCIPKIWPTMNNMSTY